MNDGAYMNTLSGYRKSVFQDFEKYLRTGVDLAEVDISLVLKEKNSNFVVYEIPLGIYSSEDLPETLKHFRLDHIITKHSIKIEDEDISMKTHSTLWISIVAMRFDEKSFFSTLLSFTPHCAYKHNKGTLSENLNLDRFPILDNIHSVCDAIDVSVVKGVRQPKLFGFILEKPPGYKVVCEPENIRYERMNEAVPNTIAFV